MITHTNAVVKLSNNRLLPGVIEDDAKFVSGSYNPIKNTFRPDIADPREYEIDSVEHIDSFGEDLAVVTPK